VRALVLILALVCAPAIASASVAAFPRTASGVLDEISTARVGASSAQAAEVRQEIELAYGECSVGIVFDPINNRDPTGKAVIPPRKKGRPAPPGSAAKLIADSLRLGLPSVPLAAQLTNPVTLLASSLISSIADQLDPPQTDDTLAVQLELTTFGLSPIASARIPAGAAASVIRVRPGQVPVRLPAAAVAPAQAEVSVAARVAELKVAIPESSRGFITMAVGRAEQKCGVQKTLIATSEPRGYLRPGVTLKPGEILVRGDGHAEMNLVQFAKENDMCLREVGATRPFCPECTSATTEIGAKAATR